METAEAFSLEKCSVLYSTLDIRYIQTIN